MAINVKTLGDRVLVQPLEEKEVKKGDIIIPDTAEEKPRGGTVAAVGTEAISRHGSSPTTLARKAF
jgi:chaperonin GroES